MKTLEAWLSGIVLGTGSWQNYTMNMCVHVKKHTAIYIHPCSCAHLKNWQNNHMWLYVLYIYSANTCVYINTCTAPKFPVITLAMLKTQQHYYSICVSSLRFPKIQQMSPGLPSCVKPPPPSPGWWAAGSLNTWAEVRSNLATTSDWKIPWEI